MQNSLARSSIDVGSVIAGTYTIEALIGRGGMGAVFLASHNRLPGKKVAIKVLHAELEGVEILGRFKHEAEIASMLSHPNIVHIEDYNVTAEGMPYVVLEYLQGESLAQRLRRGPLSLEATLPILRQVGSALAAAHAKGIIHRDLKPQNIFLVPSELDGRASEIAKVLDFGISKMRDSQTVKTQDNAVLGTPQYMAPEQATGQHDKVDERTDIFALGAIVYEMLSGAPAFSGQTIPEVVFKVVYEPPTPLEQRVPALSKQVTSAVARALAKNADERFGSVAAFLEGLTGAPVSLIRNPTTSRPPPATVVDGSSPTVASGDHGSTVSHSADALASTVASAERARPVPSRSRRTLVIAGGLLAAAVAAAAIAYVALREPPAPPATSARESHPAVADRAGSQPAHRDVPAVEKELLATPAGGDGSAGSAADGDDPDGRANVGAGGSTGSGGAPRPQSPPDTHTTKRRPPPATDADDTAPSDDSRASDKLRRAFGALNEHRWREAGEHATGALTAEGVKPMQQLQAKMILGIVACHTSDQGGASAALRALAKRPRMREKVLAACRAANSAD